ncbi:MAG TPA: hypothetical protein PLJ35_22600 [Anaerolineae bacterium]|nr:hypothetical protein [Anaerolineae bacterium]HOR01615.1 hypothetical protein [Anaerolineae bacterium]
MDETLPLIIFAGAGGESEPERWVARACHANTADLVARAAQVPAIGPIIVTAPGAWHGALAGLPAEVELDAPGGAFHFGRRLREVATRHGLARFLYIGGGAGVLLGTAALAELAARALALERGVIANNLYSADFAAVAPAAALDAIALPESDNDLAYRLAAAGLPAAGLPASAATRLDLDTPTDLLVAALHPACGPELRRYVASLPLPAGPAQGIIAELANPRGEVLVYGRVAAAGWAALERLPCQTRLFSEERGMRASGRQARGEVHAWLGSYLQAVGPQAFFQALCRSCTAALLDTRVLFAHLGLCPSAADRFYSDLLMPQRVADPMVRALTEAALAAPVPLMLGGQSLVSGDLLALAEVAHPA